MIALMTVLSPFVMVPCRRRDRFGASHKPGTPGTLRLPGPALTIQRRWKRRPELPQYARGVCFQRLRRQNRQLRFSEIFCDQQRDNTFNLLLASEDILPKIIVSLAKGLANMA
jgi:hypothetical protein